MNNILEDLKKYFRETPREKIMSDWADTKLNSPKGGPKLREFMFANAIPYPRRFIVVSNINNINPKYSSGCFL